MPVSQLAACERADRTARTVRPEGSTCKESHEISIPATDRVVQ